MLYINVDKKMHLNNDCIPLWIAPDYHRPHRFDQPWWLWCHPPGPIPAAVAWLKHGCVMDDAAPPILPYLTSSVRLSLASCTAMPHGLPMSWRTGTHLDPSLTLLCVCGGAGQLGGEHLEERAHQLPRASTKTCRSPHTSQMIWSPSQITPASAMRIDQRGPAATAFNV